MYQKYIKRVLDFSLSLFALLVLSPFLILFIILGAIIMKGNPFFTQDRPGKKGKIFKLINKSCTCYIIQIYFFRMCFSSDPELTPIRIGIPR